MACPYFDPGERLPGSSGSLGDLYRDQGRMEEARAHCDQALATHRAVGNRRSEGAVLGSLGDLLARQGRLGEAREAFGAGEAILREVGDKLQLASLLCIRGRVEVAAGNLDVGRAALAAAATLAVAMDAGPESEVCREIAKLRDALARPEPDSRRGNAR